MAKSIPSESLRILQVEFTDFFISRFQYFAFVKYVVFFYDVLEPFSAIYDSSDYVIPLATFGLYGDFLANLEFRLHITFF